MPVHACIRRALLGALLISMSTVAVAQDQALAEELIRLRGEVETLNAELDSVRDEQRTQMAFLAQQRAQMEADIKRQELAISQTERQLSEAREAAQAVGADVDLLRPTVLSVINTLIERIEKGIPFKRVERRTELDELRRQIEGGSLPATRAVNRLWAFLEDELRLTRENGIYSQTIELDGQQVLADVAKLGTMMLFFSTPDGRVGQARRDGARWSFQIQSDAQSQQQIHLLFDSLRKQIRQGYFELPNALAGGVQ